MDRGLVRRLCGGVAGLLAVFVEGLSAVFVVDWPADHLMAASFKTCPRSEPLSRVSTLSNVKGRCHLHKRPRYNNCPWLKWRISGWLFH